MRKLTLTQTVVLSSILAAAGLGVFLWWADATYRGLQPPDVEFTHVPKGKLQELVERYSTIVVVPAQPKPEDNPVLNPAELRPEKQSETQTAKAAPAPTPGSRQVQSEGEPTEAAPNPGGAGPSGDKAAEKVGGRTEVARTRRQALEQLPKGKVVLEAPKTMRVGEFRVVYANVGINVDDKLLRRHARPSDQAIEGALSVSTKMSAVLTGSGFKIKNTTPEEQDVTEGFVTVWNWEIEARQEGEQELEATLYVTMPGIARQRIDSYSQKIGVAVREQTWGEWLKCVS